MSEVVDDLPRPVLPQETDPIRRNIVDAIRRMLAGTPSRVEPGNRSVGALATEAGVTRNDLYRAHADLRDLFERLKKEYDTPNPREAALIAKNWKVREERDALQSRYDAAREELAALEAPAAPAEESHVPQVLEPYSLEEQDEDARTLAEVKASLLAEIDGTPESTARRDEDDEDEAPASGPSLAERIRALEAGVAH